jgi:hypothetical protein
MGALIIPSEPCQFKCFTPGRCLPPHGARNMTQQNVHVVVLFNLSLWVDVGERQNRG